ncbi:MAG: DUF1987 domain-containing protein [Nitrospirae bacterium]|uniref:DUF1987 domain-containing protein n=1 Tax=Candidatus Magnetobacterium casense TaxID=1455061 RepID=UPI00058E5060|nr:DUF1987 domain-containing protein [Candidatus Magnetobacterium casensis]MBF0336482.1 DUF1987 domain-containing protein [Nitrospirota bacterium]
MEKLCIQATKSTPHVCFDPDSDTFTIKGECYPENAAAFFTPIFAWLEAFLSLGQSQPLVFDIELLYFNSSSSKALLNLFSMLERYLHGRTIIVNWKYHADNDTAMECGEEFKEDAPALDFNLVELE